MSVVIKAEDLSKSYLISHQQDASTRGGFFSRFGKQSQKNIETFWALQDINFEIEEGQRLGIIGSNGAGKSTLLKILSRITPPSSGKVTLHGRVSSLLEVGTGFHPELSGRENIFMNGAILGMSRQEIKDKFDAIVDFSEVEKFLDTPVKRYSSGMYVRLAFAVAAHLEPEILIVDEVLAVGDAAFQKKCLGKMGEVSSQGRTVLFVSHNLNAVQQLCDSAMYLNQGQIVDYVRGTEAMEGLVSQYYVAQTPHGRSQWRAEDNSQENEWFSPTAMYVHSDSSNEPLDTVRKDESFTLCIEGDIKQPSPELSLGYMLYDEFGTAVFSSKISDTPEGSWPQLKPGHNCLKCRIPAHLLNEGNYQFKLIANVVGARIWLFKARQSLVSIELTVQGGISDSPHWTRRRPGTIAPVLEWQQADDDHG